MKKKHVQIESLSKKTPGEAPASVVCGVKIYMADFGPAGPHPVIVISREELNRGRYALVVVCTSARFALGGLVLLTELAMSRLTLRLPETLHRQLETLAKHEQTSLNQYIVYALTRQAVEAYTIHELSEAAITQQRAAFEGKGEVQTHA